MDIGSFHADGGIILAAALVVACVAAMVVLRRQTRSHHEGPVTRAVRLAREAGLIAEQAYYVPNIGEMASRGGRAYLFAELSYAERHVPRPGTLVQLRNGKIYVAPVQTDRTLERQDSQWRQWTVLVREEHDSN